MARPRSYEWQKVVAAAKQVFWDHGYEKTALDDVESATGLSRSSLYLAFDSKRALFEAALAEYMESFVDPLLDPVEAPGAGLKEAAGFFLRLATLFGDRESQRGCLMINSIAELARADPAWEARGAQFANRYRVAFLNALRSDEARGAMDHRQTTRRAEFLAAAAVGVWLAVRVDHLAAAVTCRAIATDIRSWSAASTARQPRTHAHG